MSDFTIAELLIFQLVLILLNAVFACAEIAVISINDNKLKNMAEAGNKKAKRLTILLKQPADFLATIQIGITLAGFLGSAFAADNFSDRIVNWLIDAGATLSPKTLDVLSVIGITLVLSYITLILGELVPKRIAMNYAEKIGLSMSGLIYAIAKIFAPLVWLLTASTNAVLHLLRINPDEKNEQVTEEEIRMMIDVGNKNGAIDDIEKNIIHNVFEFDDKLAEEVMTHRTDVTFLNVADKLAEWDNIIINSKYSVYPVYENDSDNIIGTLSLKDYIKHKKQGKKAVLRNALKPAQFISKSKHIDDLFAAMQKSRNHFAIVVDEYGGVFGIVTMNDLLEEIVGDLEDDEAAPTNVEPIKKINNNTWIIQGYTPIEDVSQVLGTSLNDENCDTFAGFLLSIMGGFPENRKSRKFIYQNLKIKIAKMKGRRLEEIVVQQIPEETKTSEKTA